ncbi:hypothetical protein M407DRAFT_24644 [Tulasnella calospora MUT 4182]|uniref:Mob1/phocein n=1 Tax=Tulasnella calospora MUT 4182 TaxID=1051891 RepID=A0A0C3QHK1_9AGAM|nr:hypothetical protein M407DRAFT_24644 [Tulasnella calospora MUT 4182]
MTAVAIPRRPTPGSRLQDAFPARPANLQLSDIDSAFPLQEYIAHLVQLDPHDVNAIVSVPEARKDDASGSGGSPEERELGVDESCWIYEQLRRLAQDLTHPLITSLQAECNRTTCPEMKAGEWLYLCVAHGTGPSATMEQCCAIDYITHTLDSATALLNSPRAFPSRLQIPPASKRQFPSLARRLSRIFAHAYYHHREAFEQAEAESSLYARFLMLAKRFDLVPTEFLVLPGSSDSNATPAQPPPPTILQAPTAQQFQMPSMETGAPHSSSQISSPPKASETQTHPALVGLSLPMQRTGAAAELLAQLNREGTPPVRESSSYGGGGYANATVKGGAGQSMSDGDRRALLNRSRTDTMYMKDFDLAEFAAAAGDAMAAVNAENAQDVAEEEGEKQHDEATQGDDFVEVEMEDHHEPRGHEQDHPEDVDAEMLVEEEDLEEVVADEPATGVEEPAPTPEAQDATHPSQPAEGDDVVEALGTALSQSTLEDPTPAQAEEPVPAVEPSKEAGVAETTGSSETDDKHVPLVPGEVKAVPAHLGLESEPKAERGQSPEVPEWGETMDLEEKET